MGYCSVKRHFQTEVVIKKSRFIAILQPVETLPEAEAALAAIRRAYPDATHHCFAFRLGPTGQPYRFSDDREPSGTAGKPIYQVLEKYELSDVLLVVVRYFGGIKLGTGGLVRAYRQAAEQVVQAAEIVEKTPYRTVRVTMEHHLAPVVEQYFYQHGLRFEATYGAAVTLTVAVPEPQVADVVGKVLALLRGKGKVETADNRERAR